MKLLLALCAFALVWSTTAAGSSTRAVAAPTGLHAFEYRADEPVRADHTYAQLPAFAWSAIKGASTYELQLATSSTFSETTTFYDNKTYQSPVASVQLQVPWMTGKPYALWVHVRAVAHGRASPWSTPFGFNTAWQEITQERAPTGLIRWSPVDGATSYDVWYVGGPDNYSYHFSTLTNVADEREYWTFHPASAATINWRVRAVRAVQTGSLPNGIPVESHGPYSPIFTTTNPTTLSAKPIKGVLAVSNVNSTPTHPRAHQLTPGFTWTGTEDAFGQGSGAEFWRVYVFSDEKCVNQVMAGSIVGGPAWAPRNSDPLVLPGTIADLTGAADVTDRKILGYGGQSGTFMADGTVPSPAESGSAAAASGSAPAAPAGGAPASASGSTRPISLPDNGWPQGRYWWTVVPVGTVDVAPVQFPGPLSPDAIEYHDLVQPQDICAAGQVWSFGVQSAPITTTSETPYASGLVNGPRVVSAVARRPSFQELPLVTWKPALAAQAYDVEVSRKAYPWVSVKPPQMSVVTSAVLPLTKKDKGVWYYRVRGINPNLPATAQKLSWSKPVAIRISGDRFVIVK